MLRSDHWSNGPKFPWEDESHWPKMIELPVLRDVDIEVRKEAQIYVSTLQRSKNTAEENEEATNQCRTLSSVEYLVFYSLRSSAT